MGVFDIILSVGIIVIGALGCVTSIVRKPRRGQSRFVGFVISLLFLIFGIIGLVFKFPVSEYV